MLLNKGKGKTVPQYAMKTYGGVEV